MSVELRPEAACGRDDYERQDNRREHDMRDQDCEVYATDRTRSGERPRARVQVIDHVARQERSRTDERRDHAALVRRFMSTADQQIPRDEQNSRGGVEDRVEVR